jgi:hypothetical protein
MHMGRFRAYLLWRMPIAKEYDYFFTLDMENSFEHMPCDPIQQMVASSAVLGYWGVEADPDMCAGDLIGLAQGYMSQNSIAENGTIPFYIAGNGRKQAKYANGLAIA